MNINSSQTLGSNTLGALPESIQLLIKAGSQGPSPDNSQPLNFSWNQEDSLSIVFDPERCDQTSYFGPNSHASLLTLGAAVENIMEVASAAGLEPSWSWSKGKNSRPIEVKLGAEIHSPLNTSLWSHPVFLRCTNRLPFTSAPIEEEHLRNIFDLKSDTIQVLAARKSNTKHLWIQQIQEASQLRFQTRETHEWLARSLRFSRTEVAKGDGLDVATLALPPGGGYFLKLLTDWRRMAWLNRVGLHRMMAWIEIQALKQSPMILAITGPNETEEEAFEAGRMMEKIWIQLNANEISVQPYYVITDQLQRLKEGKTPRPLQPAAQRLSNQVNASFDGVFPHILLRIGHPKNNPVRSKRYPLDKVCSSPCS
ncbi:MAG: hypothetical protein V7707_02995 [Motiliproteus sp.]